MQTHYYRLCDRTGMMQKLCSGRIKEQVDEITGFSTLQSHSPLFQRLLAPINKRGWPAGIDSQAVIEASTSEFSALLGLVHLEPRSREAAKNAMD